MIPHGILSIVGVCWLISGLFPALASETRSWRVGDRVFHEKDRVWQQRDKDSEARWRREGRFFGERNSHWLQVENSKFMLRDKTWMRKERSL